MKERVQKILAQAGVASRRKIEEMITEGRVRINGQVAQLGDKADADRDVIKVGNRRVQTAEPKVYLAMNKPREVVTTTSDPEHRKTVMDFVPGVRVRVYPVGRLDFHSEGLLLLTNDGDLAHRLAHPSSSVEKVYEVKIRRELAEAELTRLRKGIRLEDGMTAPARVDILRTAETSAFITIAIHEGRNRQVRRMLEAVGHQVQRLKRIRIGPIELGRLKPGETRALSEEEVRKLRRASSGGPDESTPSRTGGAKSSGPAGMKTSGMKPPRMTMAGKPSGAAATGKKRSGVETTGKKFIGAKTSGAKTFGTKTSGTRYKSGGRK